MTLTSRTAQPQSASSAPFDALAPLRLPPSLQLTPEQFELVCAENRDAVLELASDGRVITMTPTGGETGARNGELFFQLKLFANRTAAWKAFDSSTGFRLPDGSVLSPDASAGAPGALDGPVPGPATGLCSSLPRLSGQRCPAGLAAAAPRPGVEMWPEGEAPQRLEQLQVLEATPAFQGLQLQLAEIWAA
jgi:Uma2 family endonuclease